MIRDRIVVGIRNTFLSEKLQLDAELTLTTAVAKVRQAEAVKKQQPLLRGETSDASGRKPDTPVGAVQRGRRGNRQVGKPRGAAYTQPTRSSQSQTRNAQSQSQSTCTRCGRSPSHDCKSCPAKEAPQVFKTRSLCKCMPLYSEGRRVPRRDKHVSRWWRYTRDNEQLLETLGSSQWCSHRLRHRHGSRGLCHLGD